MQKILYGCFTDKTDFRERARADLEDGVTNGCGGEEECGSFKGFMVSGLNAKCLWYNQVRFTGAADFP